MTYCERPIVWCDCDRGVKEPDCTEVLCGKPVVMRVRGTWFCLEHGEKSQAFWERVEAERAKKFRRK